MWTARSEIRLATSEVLERRLWHPFNPNEGRLFPMHLLRSEFTVNHSQSPCYFVLKTDRHVSAE